MNDVAIQKLNTLGQILMRIFRKLLLVIEILAVLMTMLGFEENWRGARDWNAYVRDHKARGESLDFKGLVPPPVPDDQNFAMTPLLAPLFQDPDYSDKLSTRLNLVTIPGKDSPSAGSIPLAQHFNAAQWKVYLGEDILDSLKKIDGELSEITKASRRPYARFPVEYEKGIMVNFSATKAVGNFDFPLRFASVRRIG